VFSTSLFTSGLHLQGGGAVIDFQYRAAPSFADIDNDGDLDLYAGEYYGKIEVFTNNNRVFTAAGILGLTNGFALQAVVGTYSAPAFADIDGDGDLDLYVGANNGFIAWFSNVNGAFTSEGHLQSNLNVDIDPGAKTRPTFRDADNDGDLDLYLNAQSDNIYLYTNNGGVFTAAGKVQANDLPIDVDYSAPTFADIDGDGDLDLYVGSVDGKIKVFNNNNGTFTATGDLETAGATIDIGNYSSPTFADLDNDGDLDLYVGEDNSNINFFSNNNGVFTVEPNLTTSNNTYCAPAFADIDIDGDLDLYVGEYSGTVEVFTNNGGAFTATNDLQANSSTINLTYRSKPTFADIDNDGDLDLYLGNGYGTIRVYTNTNGLFSTTPYLQAGGTVIDVGHYSAPTFADIDNDGDLDLYVGNGDGNITFYENLALTTGISKIETTEISIYPNPVQNQLFIELDNQEITEITIIDYSGRIVKTITNNNAKNIDVSGLTQGIYILKVSTKNGVLTNRFIKQ
ncbi:MAG: T9SS type A sorting domain-containing protein, partial [Flavobacteriales bacterium]|nr:T9SS type A sorting domain-containing protein [Flavobacteriales bacterium]